MAAVAAEGIVETAAEPFGVEATSRAASRRIARVRPKNFMEEEKGTKTDFVKEEIRNGKLFPALITCLSGTMGLKFFVSSYALAG